MICSTPNFFLRAAVEAADLTGAAERLGTIDLKNLLAERLDLTDFNDAAERRLLDDAVDFKEKAERFGAPDLKDMDERFSDVADFDLLGVAERLLCGCGILNLHYNNWQRHQV